MAATLGTELTQTVHAMAVIVEGRNTFEGKNSDEWMRAMMQAEDAGAPDREINRAHRISGILECLDDTNEE